MSIRSCSCSPTRPRPAAPSARPTARAAGLLTLAGTAALAGCGGDGRAATAPGTVAPAASAYLTGALDTMQRHSINRYKLDWAAIRTAAFANAVTAQRPSDTYAAIDAALDALGDHHSRLYRPGTFDRAPAPAGPLAVAAGPRYAADPAPMPTNVPSGRLLDARTAYVFVPAFSGTNPVGRADSTLAVVRTLDSLAGPSGPCGWVVDLRLNLGGNMYPMVAGLGPLLGDGRAGVWVDADSVRTYWSHRAGVVSASGGGAGTAERALLTVTSPYTLRQTLRRGTAPAVAVLYGPGTASSGEATAISFRGLPNARSFGTPTDGLSTGNFGYPLRDGAVLNLTVVVDGDRTGRLYGGALAPDVATPFSTPDPTSAAIDPTTRAAMRWLAAEPACAAAPAAARR